MSAPGAGQAEGEWHVVGIRYCFPRDPHTKTRTHIPLLTDGQICILSPKSPRIKWNPKPGLSAYRSSIRAEGSERGPFRSQVKSEGLLLQITWQSCVPNCTLPCACRHAAHSQCSAKVLSHCSLWLIDKLLDLRRHFLTDKQNTRSNFWWKYATLAGSVFSRVWCKQLLASSAPLTICPSLCVWS